ncbi:DUF547 domain-containing protein [Legionella sp. W05-934-2]|jgi:hypothetical protein|uniref:DUF547 domain-containing protein n=1 Tax=Legionella sp. W05-934-2 TaxID=1198649 RepID=UPI0034626F3E
MTKRFSLFLIAVISLLFSQHSLAMYQKELWPIWEANNPLSKQTIDHTLWRDFLKHHVVVNHEDIHLVNYPAITKADIAKLQQYIHFLEQIDIDNYNRDEQLAYWLNLYNALTISIVYRYYPVSSIQDINISPGLFSVGPWGARLVRVKNIPLSLEDIHNRIIRPIWNDARTHYAINNGSIGSANLPLVPFDGENIETQLNDAATAYINCKRGAQVIGGHLILSKMYKWFARDFGINDGDLIQHLALFAKEPLKKQLRHIKTIDGYIYNWHLNTTVK